MAFWNRRKAEPTRGRTRGTAFAVTVPPEMLEGGLLSASTDYPISRNEALTVPAVLRGRNVICSTLAGLPMRLHGPDKKVRTSSLLDQPERGIPRSVTMAMTYEDMLFEGVAWWRVTDLDPRSGFPIWVKRIHPSRVAEQPDGRIYIDGEYVPDSDLIRFLSPNPGLLRTGARAIRTCLKLDSAAARYAGEPIPPGYFTSADGMDPDEAIVQEFMDNWGAGRNSRASAYVPGAIKYNTVSLTPEQMQLADSRQHAVLELSRLLGLDAEDLGVSTTSRTYFNAEDRRQAFLDFTLGHYVNPVQERLSMGDVTPRGSYVKVAFEGFLRTDTLTRYQSYELGLRVGALAQDEIRPLEDRPDLTPGQTPTPAPRAIQNGDQVQQSAVTQGLTSFSSAGDVVSLAFSGPSTEFKADPEKRIVSGMLLPFNVPTADGRRLRFAEGSVTWQKSAVSRIKLDREHDLDRLLGSATKVNSGTDGVSAAFKVAPTPSGDEALALAADGALDGLSAVVKITDSIPDPVHEGGTLITGAILVRATLTAEPAFDDARLTDVALTSERNTTVPNAVETPDTSAFTSAVESFTKAVDSLGERLAAPQEREVIPAGNTAVGFSVTEAPVYTLVPGKGAHSMVRDAFKARVDDDGDAKTRLRKFAAQQQEMAQFAVVNRTVGANVIPPGYRPDLYQPQLFQGRPLVGMVSQGSLSDATPFTLPTFTSATAASATHVEGTNPTDGTLVIGTRTVAPGAISGRFIITREVVDASNPAIDAIALDAMRESYSQQTEAIVYAELNGANGVGGTITSGLVPSGAAALAVTGVGSSGAAGAALLDAVRDQITAYPFRRFASPNRLALSQEASIHLGKGKDSTGRPLLPRIGAMNSSGTVGVLEQSFDIDGLAGVPTWSMTGNGAGDADTILFNSQDVWAWESPLLTFRYEERSGPANIELALFGYFAARIVRPSGFSAVRLTVT